MRITPHRAWLLGKIAGNLNEITLASTDSLSQNRIAGAIRSAYYLLQAPNELLSDPEETDVAELDMELDLTIQNITEDVRVILASRYEVRGTLKKVIQILTLANILWCCGALGISVALIPASWPLLVYLYQLFGPLLLFLHQLASPFYALPCYSACLYIIIASGR